MPTRIGRHPIVFHFAPVVFCAIFSAGCGAAHIAGPLQQETRSIPLGQAELTHVEVSMGAGELSMGGGADNLLEAAFAYNVPAWKPVVEYRTSGSRGDLRIRQPDGTIPGGPNSEYKWDLRLNNDTPMDVSAQLGAGEARMNLGGLNLRNVDVSIGAGELEMDLRGTPRHSFNVRIHGGVGQATVRVPNHVGISASAQGGIGSIEVRGLHQRNGRWFNPGHEDDRVVIHLEIKGGVGEIELTAE